MPNSTTALERAGDWFLRSGIQEPEGGVARFYRSDIAKNATVSTEITAYALSFLVYLYQRTASQPYLDAALKAARFLTRHAWDAKLGIFPFEHSFNGAKPKPLAFFFDSGIIVRGLLSIWRVTGEREFLDTAVAAGQSMFAHFSPFNSIHPILDLPSRRPLDYEPRWSATPGCYQLKSAMAWHDLFEATGDTKFLKAYETSLEIALDNSHCFLPGDANPEKVMDRLHAYVYFLEGMLPCGRRGDCAEALRYGIGRVERYLREISPAFARSDVYAQLLRARLFAADLEVVPLDTAAACEEAVRAASFQFHSEDPRFDGGFCFGTRGLDMLPFVNPVSTAFGAQAIDRWEMWRRQGDSSKPDRHALV